MEYALIYLFFGVISYAGLVIHEIWKMWPIEKRSISKTTVLIRQAVLIIAFWPWLLPFAIYEEIKS